MHIIKNQDELIELLNNAKKYRIQKIDEFKTELEEAHNSIERLQAAILEWERLIPYDVMCRLTAHLEEQKRRAEYESECDEEDKRLKEYQAAYEHAVWQAKGSGKGLLLNDSRNKLVAYPTYCACIGMIVAIDVVKFHLGFHGEIAAWLSVTVGAVLGFCLGVVIFHANFIEAPD